MGANRTGPTRVDMGKFLTTPTARPNNAMGMPQPMEDVDNDTRVIITMNNTTLWRRSHVPTTSWERIELAQRESTWENS